MSGIQLNDFRNILGKVNDGEVIVTDDNKLQKVNFGGKLRTMFGGGDQRVTTSDENKRVVDSFMAAIENSVAFIYATPNKRNEFLARCREQLGLDAAPPEYKPLSRRMISAIISDFDKSFSANTIVETVTNKLKGCGLYDNKRSNAIKGQINDAKFCRDGEAFAKLLPKRYNGCSRGEIAAFVNNNKEFLVAMTFDRMYFDAGGDGKMDVKTAFQASVDELMTAFAKDETPVLRSVALSRIGGGLAKVPVKAVNAEVAALYEKLDGGLEDGIAKLFGGVQGSFEHALGSKVSHIVGNLLRQAFNEAYVSSRKDSKTTENAYMDMSAGLRRLVEAFNCGKSAFVDACGDEGTSAAFTRLFREKLGVVAGPVKNECVAAALVATLQQLAHASTERLVDQFMRTEHSELQYEERAKLAEVMVEKLDIQPPPALKSQKCAVFSAILTGGTEPEDLGDDLKLAFAAAFESAKKGMLTPEELQNLKEEAITGFASKLGAKKANPESVNLVQGKKNLAIAIWGWTGLEKEGVVKDSKLIPDKEGGDTYVASEAKLDKMLQKLSLEDIKFYGKYAELDMGTKDETIARNRAMKQLKIGSSDERLYDKEFVKKFGLSFYDGLKDGLIATDSLNASTVEFLNLILTEEDRLQVDPTLGTENSANFSSMWGTLNSFIEDGGGEDFKTEFLRQMSEGLFPGEVQSLMKMDPSEAVDMMATDGLARAYGFGTSDLAKVLKLLARCKVDTEKLAVGTAQEKAATLAKIVGLMMVSRIQGHRNDELPEFFERCTGKSIEQFSLADVRILIDKYSGGKLVDPNTKVTGGAKTAADVLCSRLTIADGKFSHADVAALLAGVRALEQAKPGTPVSVSLLGQTLTLKCRDDGAVNVNVGKAVFRTLRDVDGLRRMAEDKMVDDAAEYMGASDKALLLSVLPSKQDIESGRTTQLRARELCAKVLAGVRSIPLANLSSISTDRLFEIAREVVSAEDSQAVDIPELAAPPSQQYNSEDMIEMHARLANTRTAEVEAKVQMPSKAGDAAGKLGAVDQKTVHDFVADLFLNQDTWSFDAMSKGGATSQAKRLRELLAGYGPLLEKIRNDPAEGSLFDTLPALVREPARQLAQKLASIDPADDAALIRVDEDIAACAKAAMESMQGVVKKMFEPKADQADTVDPSLKSLADIGGTTQGIDVNTTNGKLVKGVLDVYFVNSQPVDQRAMLSAFIRNTSVQTLPDGSTKEPSDGVQVAELLKGAGPLLQKMLQGLPIETFPPETQVALRDMKSRLAPIPDDAVKAQMLELVNSSGGNILSIEVKKSLGAASVGQAFLCTIKTKEHPISGETCVIKILRPNAQTAIRREKALFDSVIAGLNDPAVKPLFDGQYDGILRELDFTLEAKNVESAQGVYERPEIGGAPVDSVHSMRLQPGTIPTMGAMIVTCAPGQTCDQYMDETRHAIESSLKDIRQDVALVKGGSVKTVYQAKSLGQLCSLRRSLMKQHEQIVARRAHVSKVLDAMFTNAIFGNGFFHADLHGGNIMVNGEGATLIDFGNCGRLLEHEQESLRHIMLACMLGEPDRLDQHLQSILSEDGKVAFNALDEKTRQEIRDVLKLGEATDVLPRLFAVLTILQRKNVPIPSNVYNFIQSYNRIAGAISGFDDLLAEVEGTALSLELDPAIVHGDPDQPQVFKKFDDVVGAFAGNATSPSTRETVRAMRKSLADYLESAEGKKELDEICQSRDSAEAKLRPFIDRCRQFGSIVENSNVTSLTAFDALDRAYGEFIAADADSIGKKRSAMIEKLKDLLKDNVKHFVDRFTLKFGDHGVSPAETVGLSTNRSMRDIISNPLKAGAFLCKYQNDYNLFTIKARGDAFEEKLSNVGESTEGKKKRIATAKNRMRAENSSRPIESRMTVMEMMRLEKCVRDDFRLPSGDHFGKPGWSENDAEARLFREMLELNLKKLRTALNIAPDQPIPASVIMHAFGLLGLAGAQGLALPKLEGGDFTLLLAKELSDEVKTALTALEAHPTLPLES